MLEGHNSCFLKCEKFQYKFKNKDMLVVICGLTYLNL